MFNNTTLFWESYTSVVIITHQRVKLQTALIGLIKRSYSTVFDTLAVSERFTICEYFVFMPSIRSHMICCWKTCIFSPSSFWMSNEGVTHNVRHHHLKQEVSFRETTLFLFSATLPVAQMIDVQVLSWTCGMLKHTRLVIMLL